MRPCPRTCLIYSKDERKSAREKPRRRDEVPAQYERVALGPGRRGETQRHGTRGADGCIVGVVSVGSGHMGDRDQVRPRLAPASEGAFRIHSLRAAVVEHSNAQYRPTTRLASRRIAWASPGSV